MKWLLAPLLWGLAVVVALAVLWRVWRGRPVVLTGCWTPRFVRMVAVVCVFLGVGAGKDEAAPVAPADGKKGKVEDPLPPQFTAEVIGKALVHQSRTSRWFVFKQRLTAAQLAGRAITDAELNALEATAPQDTVVLRKLFLADLKFLRSGDASPRPNLRELLTALDEAERAGYIDAWLGAYLWRKTEGLGAERKPLIDLMARLHRHARLASTLTAASARLVRPFLQKPVAWGSKAGRREPLLAADPTAQLMQAAPPVLAALRSAFPTAEAGTWDNQALTIFAIDKGSAPITVIRAGQPGVPLTTGMVRFGRLDLLETTPGDRPVVLLHRVFGRLELPPGKLLSVWDLPGCLAAKGQEQLKQTVANALEGNETAAQLVEQNLPLTAGTVRTGLKTALPSKGASRLRLILTLFDDVPAAPAIEQGPLLGGFGGGFGGGGRR